MEWTLQPIFFTRILKGDYIANASKLYKSELGDYATIPTFNNPGKDGFSILFTHYHTMPHFDALKIYSCRKHCDKRTNCLEQAISPFLTVFSTIYGTYFHFKCTLKHCLQFVSIWTSLKFCCLVLN